MATEPAIGTRIRRARERKRWSQQRLADELHVNRKTVDNWENGRTEPRSSIGALEEVLGVRLDGADEPEMPTREEADRLRAHIREVLDGEQAEAMVDALDRALSGAPPPTGGGRGRGAASGRSGYGQPSARRTS